MIDDVPLREHLEARIDALENKLMTLANEREKQVALSLAATDRATEKAEAEALRAREAQNEWRASMNDLIGRFATIEALDAVKEKQGVSDRMMARLVGGLVVVAVLVPIASTLLANYVSK